MPRISTRIPATANDLTKEKLRSFFLVTRCFLVAIGFRSTGLDVPFSRPAMMPLIFSWSVVRLIDGDTLEAIGGHLGVASVRVSHIESKALAELIKLFHEEIECFSMKLEKIVFAAGGTLTVEECFTAFPEINESEFIILLAVCQKI